MFLVETPGGAWRGCEDFGLSVSRTGDKRVVLSRGCPQGASAARAEFHPRTGGRWAGVPTFGYEMKAAAEVRSRATQEGLSNTDVTGDLERRGVGRAMAWKRGHEATRGGKRLRRRISQLEGGDLD